MKPTTIKKLLDEVIFKVTSTPSAYAYNPKKISLKVENHLFRQL